MYTNRLPPNHQGWHESRAHEAVEQAMMQCYTLGDRYQALVFKGAVFHEILQYFNKRSYNTPYCRTVVHAFENLPQGDPVTDLLVELQCGRFGCSEMSAEEKQDLSKLPQQFLMRVMILYSSKGTRKWGIDESKYKIGPNEA